MSPSPDLSVISRKREELRELAERIRIIYNPPREYFTVVVPVCIAVLLVLGAFLAGYPLLSTEKAQQTSSEKEQQLQELLAQLDETSGSSESADTKKADNGKNQQQMGLDEIMVFATLIAITPYAIDITLQKRKIRRKEELYTEFLFKLSELMRGGLDPIKSVKELSRSDLGILTPNVRIAATSMVYGKSFEESMKAMAQSLNSDLITRYTALVVQASYSGGSVADLILKASEDMRSIISIEREKEGNLAQYVMIFYFAQGIIFFIIYTLTTSLLPYVQQIGESSIIGVNKIAGLDFTRGFFHLIMINSFFGGLIIGKIAEGEARFGLKHAVILMVAGYVACAVFILPPMGDQAGESLNISVVSGYDQVAIPFMSLKEPVVFQITDKKGIPLNNTVVQFSIIPGGTVTPGSAKSDDQGMVKVKVSIGENVGKYIILAKANDVSQKVVIEAKNAN